MAAVHVAVCYAFAFAISCACVAPRLDLDLDGAIFDVGCFDELLMEPCVDGASRWN